MFVPFMNHPCSQESKPPSNVTSVNQMFPSSSNLQVEHDEIEPQNIIYTILNSPNSGFLVALSQNHASDEPPSLDPIQTFTQEDVNEGKVLFLHSSPEIQRDQFLVDVTADGVDALKGIVVDLEILPISVPLEVHNFTVTEGHSQVLSMDILNIPSTYSLSFDVEFVVVEIPEHGTFRNMEKPEEGSLNVFSWYEVGSNTISSKLLLLFNLK